MYKVPAVILVLAGIWLVRPGQGHATVSGECPSDSAEAAYYFEFVSPMLVGDEPDDISFRQEFGIPPITPAEAAVVADSAGCAQLRQRVDAHYAVPAAAHIVRRGYTVYPMRFGDYRVAYVVINPEPGMAPGGRDPAMVFHGDSLTQIITVLF